MGLPMSPSILSSRRSTRPRSSSHSTSLVGRTFGYRNRHVYVGTDPAGNPLRSHVVHEVDPTEAAAVLRLFELFAGGLGLKAVATTLNAERAPSP